MGNSLSAAGFEKIEFSGGTFSPANKKQFSCLKARSPDVKALTQGGTFGAPKDFLEGLPTKTVTIGAGSNM